MRNKKNKLLAFSVLALCVACLAFGVYALKNATLTINGTVGFTAHDCLVYVVAEIEGDGVAVDANGTVTPNNHGEPSEKRDLIINKDENSNEMLVGGASESEWEKVAPVGAIYFTDLTDSGEVAQIKMTFTLTNQSAYSVTASISNEQFDLANIVVGASEEITLEKGATGTLTATFDLNANDNGEYPEVNNLPFEVKLDFRKATTGGNQGGGEETETPEYLTGIPQTVPEIMAMFEGTEYTPTEQPGADQDATAPAGLVGGVTATNESGTYSYMVFDSVGNLNAYYAAYGSMLEQAAGKDNVVIDGLVVAAYMGSSSIGGGEEVLTPVEAPANTKISDDKEGILSFDSVANANGYMVQVVNKDTGKAQTFVVEKSNIALADYITGESGTYTVSIKSLGDGKTTSDSEYVEVGSYEYTKSETTISQLDAPVISTIDGTYFKFNYNSNATGYTVKYVDKDGNSNEFGLDKYGCACELTDYIKTNGTYTVSICAIGDSVKYSNSEYVEIGEFVIMQKLVINDSNAPSINLETKTVTIQKVENAIGYVVEFCQSGDAADGSGMTIVTSIDVEAFEADSTSVELTLPDANGYYTVRVKAIGDGINYADSSYYDLGYRRVVDGNFSITLSRPTIINFINEYVTITTPSTLGNYRITIFDESNVQVGESLDTSTSETQISSIIPETAGTYYIKAMSVGSGIYTDSTYSTGYKFMVTEEGEIITDFYQDPYKLRISGYNLIVMLMDSSTGKVFENLPEQLEIVFTTQRENGEDVLTLTKNITDFTQNEYEFTIDLTDSLNPELLLFGQYYIKVKCVGNETYAESSYKLSDGMFKYNG